MYETKTRWPRAICKNNDMIDGTFRKEAGWLTARTLTLALRMVLSYIMP